MIMRPKGTSSTIILTVLYWMIFSMTFFVLSANSFTNFLQKNVKMSVFFEKNMSNEDAKEKLRKIEALYFTQNVKFISKEQALVDFKKELGEDFQQILGNNPLGANAEIFIKPEFAKEDKLQTIETQLLKINGVTSVIYHKDFLVSLQQNKTHFTRWLFGIVLILVFVSVLIINNTIKLILFAERHLIKTKELVGAEPMFIIRPYLVQTLKWNGIALIIGGFLCWSTLSLFGQWVSNTADISWQETNITARISAKEFFIWSIAIIIATFSVTLLTTFRTVKKYLKVKKDNLNNYE